MSPRACSKKRPLPSRRRHSQLNFEALEHRKLLSATNIELGVEVTETAIITANDTVPRFVSQPTDIAIRSGNWSDPSTWADGTVPTREDLVRVDEGVLVQFDAVSEIDSLEIIGQLEFVTDQDTSLLVTTITVLPSGSLTIGTDDNPVADSVSVNIVFRDVALQTGTVDAPGIDPSQYGNGLLVFGEFTTHGADKTPYIRAISDINRGDTSVTVESVPRDWRVGDRLLLPETAQTAIGRNGPVELGETEEVTISAINGNTIEFTTAVRFDHLGISDNPFEVERYAHIGNLTRNVVFQSENGEGVRGHVFLTATAVVDIDNASFNELGRTRAEFNTNNTVVDESGQVLRIGENQAGRYSFHAHHLSTPFELSGSLVEDGWRWGITVHNTDDSLIDNNIVYEAAGAGIVTEAGTETGNVFTGNLVIKVEGGHQIGDQRGGVTRHQDELLGQITEIAVDGSAFWFRSTAGTIENNFVYDAAGYGYNFNGYYNRVNETPRLNVEQIDSFQNNEVASSFGGLWLTWSQGQSNIQENYQRQTFEDLLIWNTQTGVEAYHDGRFTLSDITIIGDAATSAANEGSAFNPIARSTIGIDLSNPSYENFDVVLDGVRVSGQNIGYSQSGNSGQEGTVLRDAVFANYINLLFREDDHQDQLTTENVTFVESAVSRIANSFPDTVANRFVVESGESDEGELSEELPETNVPSLPSDIEIRDGVLRITGSGGNDEVAITESGGNLVVVSGGVESIISRSDVISYLFRGGNGDDVFVNNSSLSGTAIGDNGDDILIGGIGRDFLRGNDGNDTLQGGDGDDNITGGDGDDTISGDAGNDVVRGGDGNDTLNGGLGGDVVDGGRGDDTVSGDEGNDTVLGGDGNDVLDGGEGNDRLRGNDGDDVIRGGNGDDDLQGNDGRDQLFGDLGSDRIRGGEGEDWLHVDFDDLLLDTDDDEVIEADSETEGNETDLEVAPELI